MNMILTNIGEELASNGFLTGVFPKITKVMFGDGNGIMVTPDKAMIALVHPIQEGVGTTIVKMGNPNRLSIYTQIPQSVGGITIREVGLFNDANELIAIGGNFEKIKPLISESVEKFDFYITVPLSSAQDITVQFSNDNIYADQNAVDLLQNTIEEHRLEINKINTIIDTSKIPFIVTPIITNPITGIIEYKGSFTSSNYAVHDSFKGVLAEVIWQVATDVNFSTIVREYSTNTITPYTPTFLEPFKVHYIRVRYVSDNHKSNWSTPISFTTPNINLGGDGLNTILAGNNISGAYYGEVLLPQLLGTRDYRGYYRTATLYKATTQVSYGNKLWNALVDVTSIVPGTDNTKWEEDLRENLPTGKWLLDVCGVGYGLSDGNNDSYSAISTSIGALKNNDLGYLKFAMNNKLLYVAKKPFVDTIAWNDLAKRTLVYGDRTVRIGSKLYYIRLITEAEYINLLAAVSNGVLGSIPATDLALSEKTWLHDRQEGVARKAYSGLNTLESINPKNRVGSYRPVLELIEDGAEPYNNLPNCPIATNEIFQYDKYTDTGFFGEVPYTSILSATALSTAIGLVAGTIQHDTIGYLKFYWHGKILFIGKRNFRYNLSWDNIKASNAIFGVDLGGGGKSNINTGGFNYNVSLMTGGNKAPCDDTTYWNNYLNDGVMGSTEDFAPNILLEVGKFSQWNELMYRVHTQFVDNVLANQGGDPNYKELTGGVQIGENWVNYSNIDLNIYYAEAGNGAATWTQETSSYDSTDRLYRGHYRLAHLSRGTASNLHTNNGWRPSLILN